ncbi:MAG: DUF3306 domain-containing protein [Burkholderiales bacterium]|jgi:hypothetical protein|nr:DUF3306 domain-containing protein [Burkholderiales bacterium]
MSDEGFLSRWARRKAEVKKNRAAEDRPHLPSPSSVPAVPVSQEDGEQLADGQVVESAPSLAPLGRGIEGEGQAQARSPQQAPPLTLADVDRLTLSSDYTPFLARHVEESVKRAALKKLFTDPRFNLMDGLDTYIDDYSKPDPIPESMLRRMAQSKFLGLFDDEEKNDGKDCADPKASPDGDAAPVVTQSTQDHPAVPSDEDPHLRLQQDDAAGPGGTGEVPPA